MAEWCLNSADKLHSKNVIELGSGAGLVGLTCSKLCGPSSVTLTDYHPKVMETLRFNVNINASSNVPRVDVVPLDWIEFSESNGDDNGNLHGDVILASGKLDFSMFARPSSLLIFLCRRRVRLGSHTVPRPNFGYFVESQHGQPPAFCRSCVHQAQ